MLCLVRSLFVTLFGLIVICTLLLNCITTLFVIMMPHIEIFTWLPLQPICIALQVLHWESLHIWLGCSEANLWSVVESALHSSIEPWLLLPAFKAE